MKSILSIIIIFQLSSSLVSSAQDVVPIILDASAPQYNDGAIDLKMNGGFPPFIFEWTGPGNFMADTEDIIGLIPGQYKVTITDASCGVANLDIEVGASCTGIEITIPAPIIYNPTSCNANDGSIYFRFGGPSGGTYPYEYLWNTGQTETSIQDLVPGEYILTITDGYGCFTVLTYDLTDQTSPVIRLDKANVNSLS